MEAEMVAVGAMPSGLHILLEAASERFRLPAKQFNVGDTLAHALVHTLTRAGLDDLPALRTWSVPAPAWAGAHLYTSHLVFIPQHQVGALPEPARGFQWTPVTQALATVPGPREHQLITAAHAMTRWLVEHTAAAIGLCAELFTLAELRSVVEAVLGVRLDPGNFHRKHTGAGHVVATGEHTRRSSGRPAELYQAAPQQAPDPFGTRIDFIPTHLNTADRSSDLS
ncbi:hypothetical protein LO763_20110 [Glycomyces sp. A-F 0318]|uniref:NrtR DNA-binding winged helix domain-containing protein n=1 Tax=Glycomyces amatae TaxID=2881355 RepID=UPI001E374023|nr:hypothetical protein [Glycomyces amatae]MCD0445919.1 hypothetical protein [Glycomyces amatae]